MYIIVSILPRHDATWRRAQKCMSVLTYLCLALDMWTHPCSSKVSHATQVAMLDTCQLEWTASKWMKRSASQTVDPIRDRSGTVRFRRSSQAGRYVFILRDDSALESWLSCEVFCKHQLLCVSVLSFLVGTVFSSSLSRIGWSPVPLPSNTAGLMAFSFTDEAGV